MYAQSHDVNGVFHPIHSVGVENSDNVVHLAYSGTHYDTILPVDSNRDGLAVVGPTLNSNQYNQIFNVQKRVQQGKGECYHSMIFA